MVGLKYRGGYVNQGPDARKGHTNPAILFIHLEGTRGVQRQYTYVFIYTIFMNVLGLLFHFEVFLFVFMYDFSKYLFS